MNDDIITDADLWKEVQKLYCNLGTKLYELQRLLNKKSNSN